MSKAGAMSGSSEKSEPWKSFNYRIALNILFLLVVLSHSVFRDVQLEKQYTGDLRNRIVGARLQKDGKLPYFYYWQSKDGMRYFDPINLNKSAGTVSPITASPFFHQLLYPICDLYQATLSKFWFVFQWLLLTAMIWIACSFTSDGNERWLLINTGVLFTMTEAWKSLIVNGQIYLFYAFLMICVIGGLMSNKKRGAVMAGLVMAAWILNRPIGIIALLPMLLLYSQRRIFFFTTIGSLMLYGVFLLSSPFEKILWQNYADGMRMQVKLHQEADPKASLAPYILPENRQLEGIDFNEVDRNMADHPIAVYSENGNFFVLYRLLTHKKISLPWLNMFVLLSIGTLLALFYFVHKKYKASPAQILIFAFTLYMVIEILSPVYRHQYNAVQWLPLVLVALEIPVNRRSSVLFLMALGLLLNIENMEWIPMRHTLGEFLWLITIIWISVSRIKTPVAKSVLPV
jgi:hypothetical protein